MSTVQELLSKIDKTKHRLAVWTELETYLSKFMDSDAGPAVLGIVSTGTSGVAPQDILLEERITIDEIKRDIVEQLKQLESIGVTDNEPKSETNGSRSEKKKPSVKKAKPEVETGPSDTGGEDQ